MFDTKYMSIFKDKNFFFILILLIFSRIIVNLMDIQLFGISYGFHLLDKKLLQYDLSASLFYLHSQPLGWNLYVGILTKIFNGNEIFINIFFEIYQIFLTLIILKYTILIIQEIFKINTKVKFFFVFFIILNPSILFWEKIFSYQHTICTLLIIISYLIIKLFKTKNTKYELYIYLILFLLSLIWSAFQPILILFIFMFLRLLKLKIKKNGIFIFILILFLSLIPFIKNKLIFNSFTVGSWAGHQLSTTFLDWKDKCDLLNPSQINSKEGINDLKMYEKIYKRTFSHPSLIGESSRYNFVGIIYSSQECLKITMKRVFNNPEEYLIGRINAFLASHGKFAFDFMYPKPLGWDNYYKYLDNLYENKNYKLIRQGLIFIYMMSVYIFFCFIIFLSNEKDHIKKSYLTIFAIYTYILVVGHLATGHEQSRMMYSGFIIHLLFYANIIKKIFYEK